MTPRQELLDFWAQVEPRGYQPDTEVYRVPDDCGDDTVFWRGVRYGKGLRKQEHEGDVQVARLLGFIAGCFATWMFWRAW